MIVIWVDTIYKSYVTKYWNSGWYDCWASNFQVNFVHINLISIFEFKSSTRPPVWGFMVWEWFLDDVQLKSKLFTEVELFMKLHTHTVPPYCPGIISNEKCFKSTFKKLQFATKRSFLAHSSHEISWVQASHVEACCKKFFLRDVYFGQFLISTHGRLSS